MFDKGFYAFDPEKFAELFKTADFTKFFEQTKLPGFDMEAMMAAQKKNMDALVEANKAAAAGYQDLFKKQVSIYEETMSAMRRWRGRAAAVNNELRDQERAAGGSE